MAISKSEAAAYGANVDNPELLAILKDALERFVLAAYEHCFKVPLHVHILDSDGDTLREFTIKPNGKAVAGGTQDVSKLFLLPLTLYMTDANGRIARIRIDAMQMIELAEFLN
jgi:hypothetical protein